MFDRAKTSLKIFLSTAIFLFALPLFAYPSREIVVNGGPPFDFNLSASITDMLLKDDDELFISSGQVLTHIDLSSFLLASEQTVVLSSTDDTDGVLNALAYDSQQNRIVASQADGDVLFFELDDFSATPDSVTISTGKSLGSVALNETAQLAAVVSSSEQKIYMLDLASQALDHSVTLAIPGQSSFAVNDMIYNSNTDEFFASTDAGVIFYFSSSATQGTAITLDAEHSFNLTKLALHPDKTFLYGIDQTNTSVFKISTSSHAIVFSGTDLELTENSDLAGIAAAQVKNTEESVSEGDYLFVSGSAGLNILDLSDDVILDLGSDPDVDEEPLALSGSAEFLAASSQDDGFVYGILSNSNLAVISGSPWVTISSLTYSDDASFLSEGASFTLTFAADTAGDYEVSADGDITATGEVLTTSLGAAATGAMAEDESVSLSFNYADNSSNFAEGDNQLFVFVTNATDERGRIATTLTVDTPPPLVSLASTGFGDESVSVTFTRLTEADIDHYNMYVDTDADLVQTKVEVTKEIAQAATGSSLTGIATGLSNGTLYYIALEAVDAAGNKSASRSFELAGGVAASATPQNTGGPLAMAGITGGCSLVPQRKMSL